MSGKPHLPPEPLVLGLLSAPVFPGGRDKSFECRATRVLNAVSAGLFSIPWMGTRGPGWGADQPSTLRKRWAVGLILEASVPPRASQARRCVWGGFEFHQGRCPAPVRPASAGNSAISAATSSSQGGHSPRADTGPGGPSSQDLRGGGAGSKMRSGCTFIFSAPSKIRRI